MKSYKRFLTFDFEIDIKKLRRKFWGRRFFLKKKKEKGEKRDKSWIFKFQLIDKVDEEKHRLWKNQVLKHLIKYMYISFLFFNQIEKLLVLNCTQIYDAIVGPIKINSSQMWFES